MKIFGWSADQFGCGWYRMQMPLDALAQHGHETLVSTTMPVEWRDTAQVIVGQRVCRPEPTGTWQRLARRADRPMMVFEVDDDLWRVDPSSPVAYEWFDRPHVRDNLRRNAEVADVCTVTTPRLAEVVSRINPNVHVVPNMVPAWLLEREVPARQDGMVSVGWSGSQTHAMDWAPMAARYVDWVRWSPRVEARFIGGVFPSLAGLPAGRTRVTPWLSSVPDYYREIDWQVGVIPLARHPFNSSKSPIKALEQAALGIPVVAASTGPYPGFVRHQETGLLVRKPGEWVRYLRALVDDEAMRDELGRNARKYAAEHTIETGWQQWETVFTQVRS